MAGQEMVMQCPHSGSEGFDARSELENVMMDLPDNQGGAGRHKCPYCAYEAGLLQGRLETRQEFIEQLNVLVQSLESPE